MQEKSRFLERDGAEVEWRDVVQLAVYLFGYPRLVLDGRKVGLDRRKALALVAYLAMTRRPVGRDEVVALLWPELDTSRARAALRRTPFALRSAVGDGFVVSTEQELTLSDDAVWSDVEVFLRGTEPGASRESAGAAIDLYRGDFLQGFSLREAPSFDEWQLFEAERLRNRAVDALARIVEDDAATGETHRALESARRLLRLEPLHEAAHYWIMELYVRQGRRHLAAEQFERYQRMLREQLDVAPLERVVAYGNDVRQQRRESIVSSREPWDFREQWGRAIANRAWGEVSACLDSMSQAFDERAGSRKVRDSSRPRSKRPMTSHWAGGCSFGSEH